MAADQGDIGRGGQVAAADMVEVVSGAYARCARPAPRYTGRCPSTRSGRRAFSVNPADKLVPLLRLRQGRRRDHVRPRDREPRLRRRGRVAGGALPRHARVRGDARRSSRSRASAATGCTPLLDQAAAFYERHLWETAAGAPVREYLASRGLGEAVCREFRLGLSPAARRSRRRRSEKGFTRDELRAAGLTQRAWRRLLPAPR